MKLIQGDCLEILDELALKEIKVDAVITDPPYNISQKNNISTMKNKYGKPAHKKGIDFGEWDKNFDLYSWIPKANKILNKNGTMFIFNSWKNLGSIVKYAEGLGLVAKDLFRWEKTNPMPRNRDRRYIVDFELGIWLTKKNESWIFNRQHKDFQRPKFVSGSVTGFERTEHPTQKPVALMEHLIKIHTNKGQSVLDPFMGSGTTGIACKNLDRHFIGIEKAEKYFNLAKNRINEHKIQRKMF